MPLENELRVLMTLGFGLMLVLLRIEAMRFGTAEYAETQPDGRPASFVHRISWLLIGLALTLAIWLLAPNPEDLFLVFGERSRAIVGGIAYAAIGCVVITAVVLIRLRSIVFPPLSAYPVGITNAVGTAFLDEVTFRGVLLGFLIVAGLDPLVAIVIQTLVYALATRTGAADHDLVLMVLAIGVGLMGGWLTVETGGIGAAFFGHAVSRVALFLLTGGLIDTRPVDEIAPVREPGLPGWDTVDSRSSRRTRP
jgi:hypothetical protein